MHGWAVTTLPTASACWATGVHSSPTEGLTGEPDSMLAGARSTRTWELVCRTSSANLDSSSLNRKTSYDNHALQFMPNAYTHLWLAGTSQSPNHRAQKEKVVALIWLIRYINKALHSMGNQRRTTHGFYVRFFALSTVGKQAEKLVHDLRALVFGCNLCICIYHQIREWYGTITYTWYEYIDRI